MLSVKYVWKIIPIQCEKQNKAPKTEFIAQNIQGVSDYVGNSPDSERTQKKSYGYRPSEM